MIKRIGRQGNFREEEHEIHEGGFIDPTNLMSFM
jgi:hypothetical protein